MKYYQQGDKVLAFDAAAWTAAGGDISDNAQFWKPALVVRVYRSTQPGDNTQLADLEWYRHGGNITRGHFTSMFRELPTEEAMAIQIVIDEIFDGTFRQWEENFFRFQSSDIGGRMYEVIDYCVSNDWEVDFQCRLTRWRR